MNTPLHRQIDWLKTSTKVKVKDPVDGLGILRDSSRELMFAWCDNNCKGEFWIGMGFGKFELEQDAILFRLTWT